jgi:hypothetical protein
MKNKNLRLIGFLLASCAILIPVITLYSLYYTPYIANINSPKFLIANRSILDKQIPIIQNNQLYLYDQIGCGEKQITTNINKFYLEENTLMEDKIANDLLQDTIINNEKQKCLFASTPDFYIFDQYKELLTPVNYDEAIKLKIHTKEVDQIKGKVSMLTKKYIIKINQNSNLVVTPQNISLNTQFLNQNITINNKLINTDNNQPIQYDIKNIEILGSIK